MKSRPYVRKVNQKLFIKRIRSFWQKQGFYIILFLCVCAMGTAIFIKQIGGSAEEQADIAKQSADERVDDELTYDSNQAAAVSENNGEGLEDDGTIPGGIYFIEDDMPIDGMNESETEKADAAAENAPDEESVTAGLEGDVVLPIAEGEVIKPFAQDTLLYSQTLGDYRTHSGIDLAGPIESKVLAFLPGTVEAIEVDELWGMRVIINHGKGLKSIYANLSESVAVKEGQYVLSGDAIGYIGHTAAIEAAEPSHLHFEVQMNNTPMDPMKYFNQ